MIKCTHLIQQKMLETIKGGFRIPQMTELITLSKAGLGLHEKVIEKLKLNLEF